MGFHDGIVSQGFQNTMPAGVDRGVGKEGKGYWGTKNKGDRLDRGRGVWGGALAGGMPIADGCVLGCGGHVWWCFC